MTRVVFDVRRDFGHSETPQLGHVLATLMPNEAAIKGTVVSRHRRRLAIQ